MARLRRALTIGGASVVTAALLVPGASFGGRSNHGEELWAGQWVTSTGGVAWRAFNEQDLRIAKTGKDAKELFNKLPCKDGPRFYRGGYTAGGDRGKIMGCGTPTSMRGRWMSNVGGQYQNGSYQITISSRNPLKFSGTFRQDDGVSGKYTGTWDSHFDGDGAEGRFSCRRTQAVVAAPTTIVQSAEYAAFLGMCDAKVTETRRAWGPWVIARARAYVKSVATFPGVKTEGLLEAEDSFGLHSARIAPGLARTDLMVLLSESAAPDELWRGGNVFVLATVASYEMKLRRLILASKGQLLPDDVIELALKVTNGSYPLAALTAHNLLKNVTVKGREIIRTASTSPAVFKGMPQRFLKPLREQNEVVSKLSSLRQDPSVKPDKMGPWYHIFAVTTAGALSWSAGTAREIVDLEHGAKRIEFFAGEGGHDVIKHQIDHCFAFAAGEREVARVSRFWDSSLWADLFADVPVESCLLGEIKYATD